MHKEQENKNQKYFIISGVNKAGTTSLFTWLAAHPEICSPFVKQTFFFLDKEWQKSFGLQAVYDYEKGFEEFENYYRDYKPGTHKLDASPEYLYAPETPARLCQFLKDKDGYIIFILRNPVQRFITLYYYGKQQTIIPQSMNFADFFEASKNYTANKNTSLIAYETGFYSKYIERFLQHFNKEQIKIYFFEDMVADAKAFMKNVSSSIGIDETFYYTFNFEAQHKTIALKSTLLARFYNAPRSLYIKLFYNNKIGFAFAQLLKRTITKQYRKLNMGTLQKEELPPETLEFLQDAYKDEKNKLENLLGIKVPW